MKKLTGVLVATALGGALFLVPLVVVVAVFGKALELMKLVASPLGRWIPLDEAWGVLLANLLALAAVLLICLLAGLVARSPAGRRLGRTLESKLLTIVPGYGFVKGVTDSMASSDKAAQSFKPVLARFDDNTQVAFEVERSESGVVTLYLPGAPNPWSGAVIHMTAERVEPLQMTVAEAIKSIQHLGRGASPDA